MGTQDALLLTVAIAAAAGVAGCATATSSVNVHCNQPRMMQEQRQNSPLTSRIPQQPLEMEYWAIRQKGYNNLLRLGFTVENRYGHCPSQIALSAREQVQEAYDLVFSETGVCTNVLTPTQWEYVKEKDVRELMHHYTIKDGELVEFDPEVEPVPDGSRNGTYRIH